MGNTFKAFFKMTLSMDSALSSEKMAAILQEYGEKTNCKRCSQKCKSSEMRIFEGDYFFINDSTI